MHTRETYRQIARLHAANIDQGFLSSLGVSFLALLYEAIDSTDASVLLLEEKGGHVVGFVAGAVGMGPIYGKLVRRWPRLISALLPALLSPAKLRRIMEIVMLSVRTRGPDGLPQAELLSIAVSAEARGRGYARSLYRRLTQHFEEQGLESFKIVVGATLDPAHRFYTSMGARVVGEINVHRGGKSLVYVHRCLPVHK